MQSEPWGWMASDRSDPWANFNDPWVLSDVMSSTKEVLFPHQSGSCQGQSGSTLLNIWKW